MRENRSLVVAYLVSEYRRITHTFIHREVAYLKQDGVSVIPFTIRHELDFEKSPYLEGEPAPESILDDPWYAYVLSTLKWLLTAPRNFASALRLAWSLRQPGARGLVYTAIYCIEAVALAEKCRRRKVTHLHNVFGDASGNVAAIAAKLLRVPLSFTFHGPDVFHEAKRWCVGQKIREAAFSVATSHYARRQLLDASGGKNADRIRVIHSGVDPDEFVPHAPLETKGEFRFLTVARVAPTKGIPVLFDAFAEAQRHSPLALSLDLVCAASPGERVAVELEVTRRNLPGLTLHFNLANPDVRALMGKSHAVVCASYAEGLPLVLIEAMALGRAVISTAVGGIPELILPYRNGLLVPAGDPLELAMAMLELATDPGLALELGLTARRTALDEFDARVETRRLKELFHAFA